MDDIILVAPFNSFNQLKHIVSKTKKKNKDNQKDIYISAPGGVWGRVDVALVSLGSDSYGI